MYKVASRFEDGYEAVVAKSVGTLAEAIDLAFGIADHAGDRQPEKSATRHRCLSIAVVIS